MPGGENPLLHAGVRLGVAAADLGQVGSAARKPCAFHLQYYQRSYSSSWRQESLSRPSGGAGEGWLMWEREARSSPLRPPRAPQVEQHQQTLSSFRAVVRGAAKGM